MRKNYFAKLVKYMKNVYNIDRLISQLEDSRVNPKYRTGHTIMPVLLGFVLRIKSINQLKFMIKENEFAKAFSRGKKLPQIDTSQSAHRVINSTILTYHKHKSRQNNTSDGL